MKPYIFIVLYFIVFFALLYKVIIIAKSKNKKYLACPKTGKLSVDPDKDSPCLDCHKSFYGKT